LRFGGFCDLASSVLREKGERFMVHCSLLPRWADLGFGGVFCLGFEGFVVDYGSKEEQAAPTSGKHHLVRLLRFWTSMADACKVDIWVGEYRRGFGVRHYRMLRRSEIEPAAFSAQKETPFAGRKPGDAISGEVHIHK